MNIGSYMMKLPLAAKIATLCAVVLLVSWVAGQCRTWSTPEVASAVIDAGTPIAGPVSQAPTVTAPESIARPDLSIEELRAEAKKYGLQLTETVVLKKTPPAAPGASVEPEKEPQELRIVWPKFLAAESFKHAPSGADVDVSAWLPGEGQRVDLRASWRAWTPPPAAPAYKPIVCQSGGFFENEAKWYGAVGYGVVANSAGAGLGPTADLGYLGPRTGKVTWGAGSHAAHSKQSGFQGDASFRMTW